MIIKKIRKFKMSKNTLMVILGCILLNTCGKILTNYVSLPFWLDTIGTILGGALLGPIGGIIIGFVTNCIQVFFSPINYYYCFVNMVIGIYAGLFYSKDIADVFQIVYSATILSIITTLLCVPMHYMVNDGYIGNKWGNALYDMLSLQGVHKVIATILGTAFIEFPDKVLSMFISNLFMYIPRKIKKQSMNLEEIGGLINGNSKEK